MMTTKNYEIPNMFIRNYLDALIGKFFKILPIKESGETSLRKYIESLQRELVGSKSLISALQYDDMFLSLIVSLQYLLDNDCDVHTVKYEVFKAIDICKKLKVKHFGEVN